MKRALLVIASVTLLLFGALKLVKMHKDPGNEVPQVVISEAARSRTASFWNLYYEATRKRTGGDFEAAAELYRAALRLKPGHEESLYYLANCLYEEGEYSEAISLYRAITKANQQSQRAFSQLGVVLSTWEPGACLDFDQARQSLERSTALNREESGPFLKLGLIALNQGHWEEALTHFQTAAGFRSPEGTFLTGLARFLRGDDREASGRFLEVLEQNAREKAISGRGIFSEGDIVRSTATLTPLEAAGLKSLLFLYWTACRSGGYPTTVPGHFRLALRSALAPAMAFRRLPLQAGRGSWADFDRDGDNDLACADQNGAGLFRNDNGNLQDVSTEFGLRNSRPGWDAIWGDADGDGYPDLYVVRAGFVGAGANSLYLNQKGRGFKDVTVSAGLAGTRATTRAVFLDYDRDGHTDLLEVGNDQADRPPVRLYRNLGGVRFSEVTNQAGLAVRGHAVDCSVADFNGDGWADVLVTRWRRPPVLFEGSSSHRFVDVTMKAGLNLGRRQGFSSLFFDFDRDGLPDIFFSGAAPMAESALSLITDSSPGTPGRRRGSPVFGNRLFRNLGNGAFAEVTDKVGLHHLSSVMQATAADFDGDSWTDLLLASGGLEAARVEPSLVLHNDRGRRLVPWFYLPGLGEPARSIGSAVSDSNGDKHPDIYLAGVGLFLSRSR